MKIVSTDPLSAPRSATAGRWARIFEEGPVDAVDSFVLHSASTVAPSAPWRFLRQCRPQKTRAVRTPSAFSIRVVLICERTSFQHLGNHSDPPLPSPVGGKGDDVGQAGVRRSLIGVGIAEPRLVDRQRHRLKSTAPRHAYR